MDDKLFFNEFTTVTTINSPQCFPSQSSRNTALTELSSVVSTSNRLAPPSARGFNFSQHCSKYALLFLHFAFLSHT